MTTTAEQIPTPQEVRDNLAEATQELNDLHAVINAHNVAKDQLVSRYNRLMATAPDQFGPDGSPKPKSEAAKVSAELGQRNVRDFTESLQYAIGKQREAEGALQRHKGEHADLWTKELLPDAEALVTEIHQTATELHGRLRDYQGMYNVAWELCRLNGGLQGPNHVNLERVRKAIEGVEQLTLDQCGGDYAPLALPLPELPR